MREPSTSPRPRSQLQPPPPQMIHTPPPPPRQPLPADANTNANALGASLGPPQSGSLPIPVPTPIIFPPSLPPSSRDPTIVSPQPMHAAVREPSPAPKLVWLHRPLNHHREPSDSQRPGPAMVAEQRA